VKPHAKSQPGRPEVAPAGSASIPPSDTPAKSAAQAEPRIYAAVQDARPEAIVVHCSDPRFQSAFDQFVLHELGLAKGRFIPIVVGGGAGVLMHPEQLPKEFKFLKERFEHYRELFPSVRRIVLINHEDCRYYASLKNKVFGFLGARTRATPDSKDLPLLGNVFRHFLAHLGVSFEVYYAKFSDADHNHVVFEKVWA
jgi:hypothetical protein